ncbi:MAG: archaemetzincin family Zn-dependent metalloprotease [Proteobacteria bacterium]|nr:archaemetzincin family Zn-dependent metalloprotease [Pseudomonadota bacterium]
MGSRSDIAPPPRARPERGLRLWIVPIGLKQALPWTEALAAQLRSVFGGEVIVAPAPFGLEASFDPQRGQYNALELLERLLALPGSQRLLGIVEVDLFIPMLTYVFGQAQLNGRGAILSSYRLDNTIYGLARDDRLRAARIAKEAIHELGHALGLVHCRDPDCVMHSSLYVEEIDLKSAALCACCRRRLREVPTE